MILYDVHDSLPDYLTKAKYLHEKCCEKDDNDEKIRFHVDRNVTTTHLRGIKLIKQKKNLPLTDTLHIFWGK